MTEITTCVASLWYQTFESKVSLITSWTGKIFCCAAGDKIKAVIELATGSTINEGMKINNIFKCNKNFLKNILVYKNTSSNIQCKNNIAYSVHLSAFITNGNVQAVKSRDARTVDTTVL